MEDQNNLNLFVSFIVYLLLVVAMWKIFVKAGEAGWKSLIPIFDFYYLFKIAMGNGWLFLLMLIPLINVVIVYVMFWKLAKSFGYGIGMRILTMLVPNLGTLIIGFGGSVYIGPQ
ncbi:hypothetical protein BXO88_15745 [Oribacterium sp. C9]|uniref:DUF5684 domain-containing protein n=1 Tax=Oribacterium sp. C9 TaxID=1943579 RepID=UPI00098EC10F|nr:DUF5684 domain-containing protein [Oribacterium sp. C9]OON84746.1 hypothetical protein BXO88_15745 [Oribacterium sp. C9]